MKQRPIPFARQIFLLACSCLVLGISNAGVLDNIKARGTLTVCIWPDYFGISYQNPKTGELQGLDIDMSKSFAADLGVKLSYVNTNFASFMDLLEQGACDIAMMGSGVTQARKQRIDFSEPYLRSDVYFITTKANQALQSVSDLDHAGVVIAVQRGTYMEPFAKEFFKNASVSVVSGQGARELEVETGRADAFATDYPYSQKLLSNTDWARLIRPTTTLKTTDYAYAVRKGDPIWLSRVNEFVKNAQMDGRLESAARKNNLLPILIRN